MSAGASRLTLLEAGAEGPLEAFSRAVLEGLSVRPKRLPCRFFYDAEGSRLFREICELPDYDLQRAEREILEARAEEIVSFLPARAALVDLGSGDAAKTRLLIEAARRRCSRLLYVPLDISRAALEESARALLADFPGLEIVAIHGEYAPALRRLAAAVEKSVEARLFLWLGSNVGNFDRAAAAKFLRGVRETMPRGDRLLLGADLRKERALLERAYDDGAGVTARFNLNLLARVNRELGGRFDLSAFRHRAVYEEEEGRVRMFLVSLRAQRVAVEALGREFAFEEGEAVHTEDSYKYSLAEIDALAAAAGFRVEGRWLDRGGRFCESLLATADGAARAGS